jgi:hypothetical protein
MAQRQAARGTREGKPMRTVKLRHAVARLVDIRREDGLISGERKRLGNRHWPSGLSKTTMIE